MTTLYRALSASAVFVAAVALPGAAMADTSQTITSSSTTASVGGVNFGISANSTGGGSSAVTATRRTRWPAPATTARWSFTATAPAT